MGLLRPITLAVVQDDVLLDRAATRRVFRRATELTHANMVLDDPDRLDGETLVDAAVEAGIPEREVRWAVAVERLGPAPAHRMADGLLGSATVAVDEELVGSAGDAMVRLDAWLVAGHHLRRDRLRGDHGVWRKRRGVVAATFRTVRHATGEGHLGEVRLIEARAIDTGTGTCVVRVAADRGRDRRVRGVAGAVVAALGTGVIVGIAAVTAPLMLAVTPLAVLAGAGLAATGRGAATAVENELDRVLDAVDREAPPVRLSADVVRRVIGGPPRITTDEIRHP